MADNSSDVLLRVPKNAGKENTWISMQAPELTNTGNSSSGNNGDSVATNLSRLKSYILTYGKTNSKGNKFIKKEYSKDNYSISAAIVYEASTNRFEFIIADLDEDDFTAENVISFYIPASGATTSELDVILLFTYSTGDKEAMRGTATLNLANYHDEDSLNYTWSVNSGTVYSHGTILEKDANEIADGLLSFGLLLLDDYLSTSSLGFHLEDIGFTSYES
jgi:hypothetical protein